MNGFLLKKELSTEELIKKGYDIGELQEDDSTKITYGEYEATGFVDNNLLFNIYNINKKGTFEIIASLIENFRTEFLPDNEEYITAIMTRSAAPLEELEKMDQEFIDKLKPYLEQKFNEFNVKVNENL